MFAGLTGWHLVVILFIILLLFGAPKLPGLAKSLGQSMRILEEEYLPKPTRVKPRARPAMLPSPPRRRSIRSKRPPVPAPRPRR